MSSGPHTEGGLREIRIGGEDPTTRTIRDALSTAALVIVDAPTVDEAIGRLVALGAQDPRHGP